MNAIDARLKAAWLKVQFQKCAGIAEQLTNLPEDSPFVEYQLLVNSLFAAHGGADELMRGINKDIHAQSTGKK